MFPVSLPVGSICFTLVLSVVSPQPTYILAQQRSEDSPLDIVEAIPYDAVEYQEIVPSGDYAIAAIAPTELSVLDYILSPVTALISLGSTALSVVSWIIINGGLVFLGMALVIGFCALTPYCTLTIEIPSFLARENLSEFPYLEELEYYFNEAYSKYHEIQNSL